MSGLGLLLEIGMSGLRNHQYGVNVTSHNIANIQTEGYSRQTAELESKTPVEIGGLVFGQGTRMIEIKRNIDQTLNTRLDEHKSSLRLYEELETNMKLLEGFFSETGETDETSISTMLSEFANAWQSLANNPSGGSERVTLYEQSVSMTEQLRTLDNDFNNLRIDLTKTVQAAVDDVNLITHEIAEINKRLYGIEIDSIIANDMRDKRDNLITNLHEMMNIETYYQENGFLNISGPKGSILVNGIDSYELTMIGDDETGLGQIGWASSSGNIMDITDGVVKGEIGGWLQMRDEIIGDGLHEGFRADFNRIILDFIWSVNYQHSKGVGVELYQPNTTLTGTYYTTDENASLDSLTYGLGSYINFGTPKDGDTPAQSTGFDLYIGDSAGEDLKKIHIYMANADTIGPDIELFTGETSTQEIADSINKQLAKALGDIAEEELPLRVDIPGPDEIVEHAGVIDAEELLDGEELPTDEEALQSILESVSTLKFISDGSVTFGFANDTSGVLAAVGINCFFNGSAMSNIKIQKTIQDDPNYICAGQLNDMQDVTYTVLGPYQKTDLGSTGELNANGTYTGEDDAVYEIMVESDCDKDNMKIKWRKSFDNGVTWNVGEGLWDDIPSIDANIEIALDEGININFTHGEYLEGETYQILTKAGGVLSTSSNINAIAISELVEPTQEKHHTLLSTIGVKSLAITREKELVNVSTDQLKELRDTISGVSLDEEFTKLIEYQRSYQAASKIITTTDEMMQTALGLVK